MEPILIATDSTHGDVCAITDFTLDMVVGHDKQDFTAYFEPIGGVGGGSLLYIDGTEYGGVVDDVTTDTESGLVACHGRTWDGVLACKRIMPPDGSAYRTVSGDANAVLRSLVTLLGLGDVFAAPTASSGITISNYKFDRFVDAYSGITRMLASAGARLKTSRVNGKTVIEAVAARTVTDEVDSDLVDFMLTKTSRCVNHLVCAGNGEGTDRIILHLYANASGVVSQTQTFFGIDEITDFYDYSNADADELLAEGTKRLQELQTQGGVDITSIGEGEWDIGDKLVARDNRSGTTVTAPIVGKTVKVDSSTNWRLSVEYEVGEASRTTSTPSGSDARMVSGVKGNAEQVYRFGDVNLTPANIGAVNKAGDTMTGDLVNAKPSSPIFVVRDEADLSETDNGITSTHFPGFRAYDARKRIISAFETPIYADGTTQAKFYVRNYADASTSHVGQQGMAIQMDKQGNVSWFVSEPASFCSAINAVKKSGDTVTGSYSLKSTNLDRDGANPSSDTIGNSIIKFVDNNGEEIGRIDTIRRSSGRQDLRLYSYNENSSSQVQNYFEIRTAKDGTQSYLVGNQAAFRTAIGIADSPTTTTTISSVITAASGITIKSAAYAARNGVVNLTVTFQRTATTTGTFTVGTIVSGKRPAIAMYAPTNSTSLANAYITTGGVVTCYAQSATSATGTYGFSFSYLLP